MRNLFTISFVVTLFNCIISSCSNEPQYKDELVFNTKIMRSDTVNEEIGLINFDFVYHNKGKFPLYIISAEETCYCTNAEFNNEALAPGDSAIMHVTYNTVARPGDFEKPVIVTYNCNDSIKTDTIYIEGYVIPIELE